jgi:hypothetical protein
MAVDQTQYPFAMDVDQATGLPIPKSSVQLTGSNATQITSDGTKTGTAAFVGAPNDGSNNAYTGIFSVTRGQLFNGSTWDMVRNNTQGTLLASQARTGTTVTPNQTNYNAKGVLVFLDVTVASGTGGLTVYFEMIDPVTGKTAILNATPAAITATGSYMFELYPGNNAASNDVKQRTAGALPRVWNVKISHGDGTTYTYSVGYANIL